MPLYAALAPSNLASIGALKGFLYGMTLANNGSDATNDIDFAAGSCADSTGARFLVGSALTKRLDAAWAVGTNAGGRMSAAAITDTTYHCFAILKDSDGSVDYGFDTSATSPTMPTGYTYFRRIGSIVRASATIVAFVQNGDLFMWTAIRNDVAAGGPSGSALYTISVPLGLKFLAQVSINVRDATPAAASYAKLISPDQTDASATDISSDLFLAATGAAAPTANGGSKVVATNTSAQVRAVVTTTTADHFLAITTTGYYDTRGRLA